MCSDKMRHGLDDNLWLLQHEKVPGPRYVYEVYSLPQLRTERVTIAGRSCLVVEALDDQKRSGSGGPPRVKSRLLARRQMRKVHYRPTLDGRQDAGVRRRREPACS